MHVRRFTRVVAAVGAAAAVATVALATPASAAKDPDSYVIKYAATGSTTLSNPNSGVTINFKPTTLGVNLVNRPDNQLGIVGNLPLAPVKAGFKAYGFLPAKGTVVFTQVSPITGVIGGQQEEGGGISADATARYVVSLRDITIGGARANVGTNCQTVKPVTVHVVDDGNFDLVTGDLTGTYNLSQFQNCGRAAHLINDTLPGNNNVLHLHLDMGSGDTAEARNALAR